MQIHVIIQWNNTNRSKQGRKQVEEMAQEWFKVRDLTNNHVESSDLCILKSDRQGSRLSVFHCRVGKRWGRCHKAGRSHDWCLICRRCDNYKLKWYKSMIRTRGTTPRQLKEYQDISLWGEQAWGEQATSNLLTIIHFFFRITHLVTSLRNHVSL